MWKAFFLKERDMDKDGFYPAHECKRCGKPLNGQGTGFPAELYAGTYNGLCYSCTSEAPYQENYSIVSGAEVWNHPPSLPSWRRDRETFYAFPDCSCTHGRRTVSRSDGVGGSYGKQCQECWRRHRDHPLVKAHEYRQKLAVWRHTIAAERAQLLYNELQDGKTEDERKAIASELYAKVNACAIDGEVPPDDWPSLKSPARKRLLKLAPSGLPDSDIASTLSFMAGNPRKRRKKCRKAD